MSAMHGARDLVERSGTIDPPLIKGKAQLEMQRETIGRYTFDVLFKAGISENGVCSCGCKKEPEGRLHRLC